MKALEKLFAAMREEILTKRPELKNDEKKMRSAMQALFKEMKAEQKQEQPLNNAQAKPKPLK